MSVVKPRVKPSPTLRFATQVVTRVAPQWSKLGPQLSKFLSVEDLPKRACHLILRSVVVVNYILCKLFIKESKTLKWEPMLGSYMVLGGSHFFFRTIDSNNCGCIENRINSYYYLITRGLKNPNWVS
jgi:hypothetical protein